MKKIAYILLLIGFVINSFSQQKRDLLQNEAKEIGIEKVLIKDFSELNFPTYYDRNFWENIPGVLRTKYIQEAEKYLDYDWPVVKATDYLEIIRSGRRNSEAWGAPRGALTAVAMGELIEGKGRFTDQIVNGCWYYSEQTWWGWSAHLKNGKMPDGLPDPVEPLLDLGVGEITNILSWTWFLFKDEFDKIHPLISKRLKDELMKKAVLPYYEREDLWWMGLDIPRKVNNWVPWVNHNLLTAILILEDDQDQKIKGVHKVLRGVDVFINQYPEDGGCDEGPSYWGHAGAELYQNIDLLRRATNGKFDIFDNQLIQNIGSYIYKAYIYYPYFINFADAAPQTNSRPQVIYSYGKDIKDPVMQNFGSFLAKEQGWGVEIPTGKIDEQIMQLMRMDEIQSSPARNPLVSDFLLPDIEIAGARDMEDSSEGFFFAAKGGHNGENHNHNDVGSCILFYNGKPCLIDIGPEAYVAKTFSKRRYEIWSLQSQYHNTPRINGQDQSPGARFKAINTDFKTDSKKAVFSTDIAGAYPESAHIKKWVRNYVLERGKKFTIQDNYEFSQPGDDPTTLNLVTSCKVTKISNGTLQLEGDGFTLALNYSTKKVSPKIEFIEVTDSRLKRYWPEGVTRIVFEIINSKLIGKNELIINENL
jgi:hypothetical protein